MTSRPTSRARAASAPAGRAARASPVAGTGARRRRGGVAGGRAVILDMRDFEPLGAELDRECNGIFEPGEVVTMHHGVDGERQPSLAHDAGGAPLFDLRALTMRDMVALGAIRVLKAELHVFEPGQLERRHARA